MRHPKIFIVSCIAILLAGCKNSTNPAGETTNNGKTDIQTTGRQEEIILASGGQTPEWLKAVIVKYLKGTDNELIKSVGASNGSWLIDNVERTDTGKYITIHIGHNIAEKDGSEPRFVTDQWIGIDSATRTIYEYDAAGDSSTVWHQK